MVRGGCPWIALEGIVTLASFTCQWRDALTGRTQRNQWLVEFESGAGNLENPLFLADVTMPLGVIGLDPAGCGTHSMRRTKPSLIYRRTKNLRAVRLLLGHTKLESTVLYLGIEVEDALELAEQTEECWLSRIDREWRGTVWLKSTLSGSSASRAANPRK